MANQEAVVAEPHQDEEDVVTKDNGPATPSPALPAFLLWEPLSPWVSRVAGAHAAPAIPRQQHRSGTREL